MFMAKKSFYTLSDLAKKRKVTTEYLARLCKLPKSDPKYIQAEKVNPRLWVITDPKIIAEIAK